MLGRRMAGLEAPLPLTGMVRAERKNWFAGDHTPDKKSGYVDGCLPPATWMMPTVAGGMASRGFVGGSGSINPNLLMTLAAQATVTGQGDITAIGGLIVNLLANISGSGGVFSADAKAFLNLLATISGSGGVASSSQLRGLGALVATLAGTGVASGTLPATGQLGATIRGYGDLTPEGLRDAVWSALATQYNVTGTMGQKLNNAASGGVDYAALGAAVWEALTSAHNTAGTFGAAAQAGGASPATIASQVRTELTPELTQLTKVSKIHGVGVNLVVTPTSRTAGDLTQTITTVGSTTTVSST